MRSIVILAGGKSRRMGEDKIFLTYQDASFLEHLVRRASAVFDRVLISAGSEEHAELIKRHLEDADISVFRETPDNPVHPEIILDKKPALGPIGGLLSVFEQTGLDCFAVIAADIPEADMQVLAVLLDRLEKAGPDERKAAVMLQFNPDFPEPCAAAYDRSSYPLLKAACEKGMRSLVKALGPDKIETVTVQELKRSGLAFAEPDLEKAFRNINTLEDYRSLSIR